MGGLTGRRDECAVLDRLAAAVRAGESRVLVLRGPAGVGKTSLLDHLASGGVRLLRTAGVQSEMELAYAGLHQLLAPAMEHVDGLPEPQRDALRVAFGLSAGPAPDRFLVGLAVLSLLSEAAGRQPVIGLVDDEQWLDRASAQVLAFVARRLAADPVGLVFAARTPGQELADLPELVVEGLRDEDARALLDAALAGPVDPRVRDLIVAETRGNPLALLELPRGMTPAELAGGFGLPGGRDQSLPGGRDQTGPGGRDQTRPGSRDQGQGEGEGGGRVEGRIEGSFQRQLDGLPADSRRLLTLAAADPSGDSLLVWRAAAHLEIPAEAALAADEAGLAEFGARVRFRHPLVRSAAYRSAPLRDRRQAHAALAEATDPAVDPDRRAWHRAQAALGPDEDVAAELEQSAGRAERRGGFAAAAAFRERAALLTPDPARRVGRLLAAARADRDAGSTDAALELLVLAESGPLDPLRAAELERLRGLLLSDQGRVTEAAARLLRAARTLDPLDPALARQAHLESLIAAIVAGDMHDAAGAALAAPPAPDPPRPVDLVLDGFALWQAHGHEAAADALRRALRPALDQDGTGRGDPRKQWLELITEGSHLAIALEVWDFEAWRTIARRQVEVTRELGALVRLQGALNHLAGVHLLSGELAETRRLMDECVLAAEANGGPPNVYTLTILAAWEGREQEAERLIEQEVRKVGQRSGSANYATAVLYNGLGRHDAALGAAVQAFRADHFGFGPQVLPELAEAAARSGDDRTLHEALDWLAGRTRVTRTEWSLGLEARLQALATDGDEAERLYRESIDRLARTRIKAQTARSHLLYGEWLRRRNRRIDAREQLRTAHRMLDEMGLSAFAERARRELQATGETARKRTAAPVPAGEPLTAQEAEVARLARDGLSNPEIGARLFISSRTAQYHLRKVFAKLGITSRGQLHLVLD
ncbi:AAA family ATPase [Actinoplanes sp. CA-054009]